MCLYRVENNHKTLKRLVHVQTVNVPFWIQMSFFCFISFFFFLTPLTILQFSFIITIEDDTFVLLQLYHL